MSDKPQKGSEEGIVRERGREGRKEEGRDGKKKTTPLSQRPPAWP